MRGWLAKALTASRGPQWVCENCHSVHGSWTPVCANCEAFDTLSWKTPPEGGISMAGTAETLPLIVGTAAAAVPAVVASEPAATQVVSAGIPASNDAADTDSTDDSSDPTPIEIASDPDVPDAEIVEESKAGTRRN